MMWEKQTEEQLNHELSEKEDLIAQLHEKDRIMEMMQENLKTCNQEKDDYTQLIFQLQRRGKFLDEGINILCLIKCTDHGHIILYNVQLQNFNKLCI